MSQTRTTPENTKAQLEALGALYAEGEGRWHYPGNRMQALSETPEQYLVWLARYQGIAIGCALSIAHLLRFGRETLAREIWDSHALTIEELEALDVDDFDLNVIRGAFGQSEGDEDEAVS